MRSASPTLTNTPRFHNPQEMKKLDINIEARTLHFRQPAGTSRGIYTERKIWLVTASEGNRHGIGECAPLPDLSCDALPPDQYEKVLRQFCDQTELTSNINYEAMRDYPSMLFGLETALLSLRSSKENQGKTWQLFDNAFSRGAQGIPINGLVWMGNYDEMLQRMETKLEQGFRCVKIKVGAIDFDSELDLVKRIRERFSPREVELRLDANGGFKPDEALYKLELLSQYAIHSIEQPVKPNQWALMAELCRDAPLPIALDEELIGLNTPEIKRQMLRIVKPAYIVLKPSLHGGMLGCQEWIDAANEEEIGSWITSALESNIGLNAIAQFCCHVYGDHITMPQGLGTGQLFTDNIDVPLEIRGDQLWLSAQDCEKQ